MPTGLGSCCGDRPELISREVRISNDAEGAKAESETHLKEKDDSLQNVKFSFCMKEPVRELKEEKEKRNTGKIKKLNMNF